MRRGDLVAVAMPGDYGKPRPALVVQDDAFAALPSVTLLLLTSRLRDAPMLRITVQPHPDNGLQKPSQVCIDKAATAPRGKVGQRIGRLDEATMRTVDTVLTRFLALA
ncbi:MAG: type II toxin-antitoxin system PemK/MazF family toxin [Thermoanaerobaculia bacterium]